MKKKFSDNLQRWKMTNSAEKLKIFTFYFIFFPVFTVQGSVNRYVVKQVLKLCNKFEHYFKCTFYTASVIF